MKNICFSVKLLLLNLLIFISQLQTHSTVYAQYQEPLAVLWGVEANELPDKLNDERNLINVDELLKPLLDDINFGGSWIDVKEDKVFINTLNVSKEEEIIAKMSEYKDYLSFIQTNKSLNELSSSFEQIKSLANENEAEDIYGYIDNSENNIVIYLEQNEGDNKNKEFIDAAKQFDPIFKYGNPADSDSVSDSSPDSYDPKKFGLDTRQQKLVLIGDGLVRLIKFATCTAGCLARDKNNPDTRYFVTSGHCYDKKRPDRNDFFYSPWGKLYTDDLVGRMVTGFLKPHDFGLLAIKENDLKPLPMIRNTQSTLYRPLLPINNSIPQVSNHGAHLCKSGHSTYVTCGNIKGFNGFSRDSKGMEEDLIVTDMLADVGDSGGPLFQFLQSMSSTSINGILVGGNKGIAVGVPLDIVLNEGDIELITNV
ncbi:hypothetical protein C2G38_2244740 [Gigaspora rosea]|uniref:Peptidase S1 domain-containing protein n=1 Tax=Gigaspora rosea TaxID=44941 RepID=A0A397VED7_9GLOM|nr:hypothetical protein C2G38_2244740 [Gigaspora rosea]